MHVAKMFSVSLKIICYYVNTPTAAPEVMLSHSLGGWKVVLVSCHRNSIRN